MRPFLLLIGFSFAAHAGVTYTSAGVFGPTLPASFFTAPSQPWDFRFEIDQSPAVSNVTADSFDAAFTGFVYRLNNVDLGLTPASITFWNTVNDGMFTLVFSTGNEFSFTGPAMYSGPLASPHMLTGSFLSTASTHNYISVGGSTVGDLVGTTVYATPEPATVVLAAGGVLVMLAARRRRR
jgi:hypothetical protein